MRRLLPLVAAAVLALAGCSGGEPSSTARPSAAAAASSPSANPSATPSRATAAPAPRAGSCYRLSYDAAVAPTSSAHPVACGQSHTAVTFSVGHVDAAVDGHLLAVDSDRVQAQVAAACPHRLASYVGGTTDELDLSMLRSVWFTPTVRQSDAGQDWFRCDLIAVASDGSLAPLVPHMAGVLATATGRDRFGMCGTDEPGAADFARVVCSQPHSWRAVQVVHVSGADYPGTSAARAAGQAPCQDAGRAAAADALDFRWGYEWPTQKQWQAGQHHGLCWVPDQG